MLLIEPVLILIREMALTNDLKNKNKMQVIFFLVRITASLKKN